MRLGIIFATLLLLHTVATGEARVPVLGGGGGHQSAPRDHISAAQRAEIQAQIDTNLRRLEAEGKLSPVRGGPVTFGWPLAAASSVSDPGIHGISNFVDQDPAFPDQLLDYNCGMRTYDLGTGYNHSGVDYFIWPYYWRRMDEQALEIVAMAPGTIVNKLDGNDDRSCGFGGGLWNAVYVRHGDGSIAWYGHMKEGSTTPKTVGETVVAGEYLGVVGSSGNSTGPHLHLEIHDAGGQLIEPYAGPCNVFNATSWWTAQRPYYDSAINRLETAFAPPEFPACPIAEPDFSRRVFSSEETVYIVAFYRDQLDSQTSDYTVFDPDGSTVWNWQHNSSAAHYAASYWYWSLGFSGLPTGTWRWQVDYEGQTVEREFEIVPVADTDTDGIPDHLDNCMSVANATQLDSDSDGYGNACDADLNNDGSINFPDLEALKAAFFSNDESPEWNPHADLNGDGMINFADLDGMRASFFGAPGPSAFVP